MVFTYGALRRQKEARTVFLSPTKHEVQESQHVTFSEKMDTLNPAALPKESPKPSPAKSGLSLFVAISPANDHLKTTFYSKRGYKDAATDTDSDDDECDFDLSFTTVSSVESGSPVKRCKKPKIEDLGGKVHSDTLHRSTSTRTYGEVRSFVAGDKRLSDDEEVEEEDAATKVSATPVSTAVASSGVSSGPIQSSLDLQLTGMNNQFREELDLFLEDFESEKRLASRIDMLNEFASRLQEAGSGLCRFVGANLGDFASRALEHDGKSVVEGLTKYHLPLLQENPSMKACRTFHWSLQPFVSELLDLEPEVWVPFLSLDEPVDESNLSAVLAALQIDDLPSLQCYEKLVRAYPHSNLLVKPTEQLLDIIRLNDCYENAVVSSALVLGVSLSTSPPSADLKTLLLSESLLEPLLDIAKPAIDGTSTSSSDLKQSLFALGYLTNLCDAHKPSVNSLKSILSTVSFSEEIDRIHCIGYFCLICAKQLLTSSTHTTFAKSTLERGLKDFANALSSNENIRAEVLSILDRL